jgi:predicted DNA repair protein MutK
MPSAGLLSLLDDIATVFDDVAVMAKLATKRTMAIAGDDLAVGAQALVGFEPARELPIVWAVTKGSLLNKLWLVPGALVLTLIAPWILTPLLMIGGAFLCYEGVHKMMEKLGIGRHEDASAAEPIDAAELEKQRIKGAIRTDVILSAEIVVIALNAINEKNPTFFMKALTLSLVAFGLTVAIYGLIALIVKADDFGLHLVKKGGPRKAVGRAILVAMPPFMKTLGLFGTIAMFLVGGGIIAHGIPGLETWLHHAYEFISSNGTVVSILSQVGVIILGVIVGAIVIAGLKVGAPLWKRLMPARKGS